MLRASGRLSSFTTTTTNTFLRHPHHRHEIVRLPPHYHSNLKVIGRRNYIFFPSSFHEIRQSILKWLDSSASSNRSKLTVKVRIKETFRNRTSRRFKNARVNVKEMIRVRRENMLQRKNNYVREKMKLMRVKHANNSGNGKKKLQLFMKKFQEKIVVIEEPSRREWFDEDGYPLTSRHWITKRFVNPWKSESSDGQHSLKQVWNWRWQRTWKQWRELFQYYYTNLSTATNTTTTTAPTTATILPSTQSIHPSSPHHIRLTWIGHSTCLISMNGFTLLTDPIFSNRASPLFLPFIGNLYGVLRKKPPALTIDQLPTFIDAVLISHDHADHLDYQSVLELKPKVKYWVVPCGIKKWLMEECDIHQDQIVEMEWWQKAHFKKSKLDDGNYSDIQLTQQQQQHHQNDNDTLSSNTNHLTVTCAPTQHWCSRSPFDRNKRLWCSFAVKSCSNNNFYFGGDTGVPQNSFPLFRIIGDKLGPFHLSALPIGAYKPQFFMQDSHCDPSEAKRIHDDIRSLKSVGIHWGTFPLAEEGIEEPAETLRETMKYDNSEEREFVVVPHGGWIESVSSEYEQLQPPYDGTSDAMHDGTN